MKQLITSLLSVFCLTAVAQNITFTSKELYPEGLSYSKKQNVFFVTSLHYGKVGKVDLKGNYTVFVDDKDLISAIGIKVDDNTNTIYVASSDPGVSTKTNSSTQMKHAKLVAYDMTTAKRKFIVDLEALNPNGRNFANDITIDRDGFVYVTNSQSPIIYKIDKKGVASIFTRSTYWEQEGFNLNGIVYHPDGFLIVAQSNVGLLYKVDIKNPSQISIIKADSIKGADGLILTKNNELLVLSNQSNKTYKLLTNDNWATAKTESSVAAITSFLTTGTVMDSKVFVLNAKLNEIFTPDSQLTSDFIIQEIKF